MLGKIFSGLVLMGIATTVMATSPYPIKNLKPVTPQELADYEAKSQAVMMKYNVTSPLKILQNMPFNSEGGKKYSWCAKQVKTTQTCTYRLENVGDDSVAGEVYQLTFKMGEASWKVASAKKAWRCQPDRGVSNAYHTKNCR